MLPLSAASTFNYRAITPFKIGVSSKSGQLTGFLTKIIALSRSLGGFTPVPVVDASIETGSTVQTGSESGCIFLRAAGGRY